MVRDWFLALLFLVSVTALGGVLTARHLERPRQLQRAAVRLGRAEATEGADALYLEGRFFACLERLRGQSDPDLRLKAEKAWLVDVPWPARSVAHLKRDLDGDGVSELFRLVELHDQVSLEVVGSPGGPYRQLEPVWSRYDGTPIELVPEFSSTSQLEPARLSGSKDVLLRTGSNRVIVVWHNRQLLCLTLAPDVETEALQWEDGHFELDVSDIDHQTPE